MAGQEGHKASWGKGFILQTKAPIDGFKPRSDIAMFKFQTDAINDEVRDDLKGKPKEVDDKTMVNSFPLLVKG